MVRGGKAKEQKKLSGVKAPVYALLGQNARMFSHLLYYSQPGRPNSPFVEPHSVKNILFVEEAAFLISFRIVATQPPV
jgi:hypothetical protein